MLRFIIDDLKNDLETLKAMVQGKAQLKFAPQTLISELPQILRDNWLFFFVLALAFASGWFVAGKYYQGLANQAVIDFIESWQAAHLVSNETLFNFTPS